MKNIILFDIDGTLYDNANKIVPQSTIDALKELSINENNILMIATGRSPYQLDVIQDVLKYFDYRILINGQVTLRDNELVGSNPIPFELKNGIFNFLEQNNLVGGFVGLNEQSLNRSSEILENGSDYIEIEMPKQSKTFHLENDIYQIWLFADQDVARLIEEEFKDVRCVPWIEKGFDILPKGASKSNGIQRILESIDGKNKTVYAFGDGINDIEMIKFADYGIAMGNGENELKEAADYITDYVNKDGISKALKYYRLIK